jgi:hypothetical protein
MMAPPGCDLLHDIVGNGYRAQRHARMRSKGSAKKYTYVKTYPKDGIHLPITDDEIRAHLDGSATYATLLIGADGLASGGCVELDTGGLDAARRVLDAAQISGVTMFATLVRGAGAHYGPHCWALFDGRYDPAAIAHQMRQIATLADYGGAEIWPCNKNIRLPWGVHTWSESRGDTILQSGEIYHNDAADQLSTAIAAVTVLPRNSRPPAPPQVEQVRVNVAAFSGASTIAVFNNAGSLKTDLEADGFDFDDRLSALCNCGGHSRSNNRTVQLIEARRPEQHGEYVVVSYSTNCKLFPYFASGHIMDRYGYARTKGPVILASQNASTIKRVSRANNQPAPTPAQLAERRGEPAPPTAK